MVARKQRALYVRTYFVLTLCFLLFKTLSPAIASETPLKDSVEKLPKLVWRYEGLHPITGSNTEPLNEILAIIENILADSSNNESQYVSEAFKQVINLRLSSKESSRELYQVFVNSHNNPMQNKHWREYISSVFQYFQDHRYHRFTHVQDVASVITELFQYRYRYSYYTASLRSYDLIDIFFLESALVYGSELLPYLIESGVIASPWGKNKTDILKLVLDFHTNGQNVSELCTDSEEKCHTFPLFTDDIADSDQLLEFIKVLISNYEYDIDDHILLALSKINDKRLYHLLFEKNNIFFNSFCRSPYANIGWCLNTALRISISPSEFTGTPSAPIYPASRVKMERLASDLMHRHSSQIRSNDVETIISHGSYEELKNLDSQTLSFTEKEWNRILLVAVEKGQFQTINWVVGSILVHHKNSLSVFKLSKYNALQLLSLADRSLYSEIIPSYSQYELNNLFLNLLSDCHYHGAKVLLESIPDLLSDELYEPMAKSLAFCTSIFKYVKNPLQDYSAIQALLSYLQVKSDGRLIVEFSQVLINYRPFLFFYLDSLSEEFKEKTNTLPPELAKYLFKEISSELFLLIRRSIRFNQPELKPFIIQILDNLPWIKEQADIETPLEYIYNRFEDNEKRTVREALDNLELNRFDIDFQREIAIRLMPLLSDHDLVSLGNAMNALSTDEGDQYCRW